ncbi:MAG: hypothetical protein R3F33_06010 [Planctomycetota bacterium]
MAYSNGRGLATVPAMETIASVDLALRKRDGGNEWTRVEGVPRKDWEELLGYFRASPYRDLTLKWQIWGEVRVNVRAGEPLVFQVFHTGDEVGAYKCGGYGQIGDEAAFAATAQRICAESRDH